MLFYILVLMFEICISQHFSAVEKTELTTSHVYPDSPRGKTVHSDAEILRLILVPKISRGEPADLGDVPYQVAIKMPSPSYPNIFYTYCGGALVKPRVVISAAHCFIPKEENALAYCVGRLDQRLVRTSFVVAGHLQNRARFKKIDSFDGGQWRRIHRVIYPESYEFPQDDLSIVFVRKRFIYNAYVKPVPIAKQSQDYGGLQCLASGFGRTNDTTQSTILRKATLEILPLDTCRKLFKLKTKKMICTTDRIADVLEGDSGGPLVCTDTKDPADPTNDGVLVGVVSGGSPGKGSVFTRITSYKSFLAKGESSSLKPHNYVNQGIVILFIILM